MKKFFRFIKNVWAFRKSLWNFRWWDYTFTLDMMKVCLKEMSDNLETKGIEVDEPRLKKVAKMTDEELEILVSNPEIIRHRLKIFSVRKNALVFLKIQEEFGSFDQYIWNFVGGRPIINNLKSISEIPVKTEISDKISKDLKKRGMSFIGSTIIYAYMQAIGLVNDHTKDCFRFVECCDLN